VVFACDVLLACAFHVPADFLSAAVSALAGCCYMRSVFLCVCSYISNPKQCDKEMPGTHCSWQSIFVANGALCPMLGICCQIRTKSVINAHGICGLARIIVEIYCPAHTEQHIHPNRTPSLCGCCARESRMFCNMCTVGPVTIQAPPQIPAS
jgi:hypothetical protein